MVPNMSPLGDTAEGVPWVCGAGGRQGRVHTHCSWLTLPSHGWLWPLKSRGDIFWGLLSPGWVGEGAWGCQGLGPWLGGNICPHSRLCHAHPTLRAIEMFHFRGPSQVGDRLVLKAIVNNAFKNRWVPVAGVPFPPSPEPSVPSSLLSGSMEVGVSAEAYGQEMSVSRRHINSAFMTFVVLDQEGHPRTLPMVAPEPGVRTSRAGFSPPW